MRVCIGEFTSATCLSCFSAACKEHSNKGRASMLAQGVDRHLFGLRLVGLLSNSRPPPTSSTPTQESPPPPLQLAKSAGERPALFSMPAMNQPFRLSTSQVAARQEPSWGGTIDVGCARGGAFAPVDETGYGVCYMLHMDRLYWHITSFRSCPTTDSARLANHIHTAIGEIKKLLG